MPKAAPTEKSSFRIVNDGNRVSFAVEGSVVGGIAEAFTWLPAKRRQTLLDRLNKKHAELLAKEAERSGAPAAKVPFVPV